MVYPKIIGTREEIQALPGQTMVLQPWLGGKSKRVKLGVYCEAARNGATRPNRRKSFYNNPEQRKRATGSAIAIAWRLNTHRAIAKPRAA